MSASIADHGVVLGDARERFIRDILERFLPANVVVGSGQVIDKSGDTSKQIDLIIYRDDFPVLRTLGTADVYLIEGVVATVEVKSRLNEESLFEALDNGKSVRNLKPSLMLSSLDYYSDLVYGTQYEKLTIPQQNSVMGMILPPVFVFSYRGYTKNSAETLKSSINKWHNDIEKGEHDVTVLPEVIATEGCVLVKNLNNNLGLAKALEKEMTSMLKSLSLTCGKDISYREYCDITGIDPDEGFEFGAAVKVDETPLQYLISSMLEFIISRTGLQQLGGTQITYNLLDYHRTPEMEGGWEGVAVNATNVADPKLDLYRKLNV